jgi:beta-galactosidase
LIKTCLAGSAALSFTPILHGKDSGTGSGNQSHRAASLTVLLNQDWLFSSEPDPSALEPQFDDRTFSQITLPHCVAPLSWQNWNPQSWEKICTYRRHFSLPREFTGHRIIVEFERVMIAATPAINGHKLPEHRGGFLPFRYEITHFCEDRNLLAVAIDSRWLNIPPEGSPKGPSAIDYLLPGGITGSVRLRAFPQIFISDVFAKPINVLDSNRLLEIACTIDAASLPQAPLHIGAELQDRGRVIRSSAAKLDLKHTGESPITLTLTGLKDVKLWDIEAPHLYDLVVTLFLNKQAMHEYRTRVGFREARFELDGFFLNNHRVQLFGLNRHELYPYVGQAMPSRVLRKDAEILRREFNCNAVRCSHYPQSNAFLDACDELGLLVWEEIPGWQYIGDEAWQELAIRDVKEMVRRDRNHPSIVIWGVRINESPNNPTLYRRTKEAARALDDSRPTSGSMVRRSTDNWLQDVFAYDDYHSASDGSVGLVPPAPGVPFFFSEAVGQFSYGDRGFHNKYRRAGEAAMQQKQAFYHAQVHDRGAADRRYAGVIAWCGFEYGSLLNDYAAVKYPGVADVFRIPKLGASFYRAQIDPRVRPVIEPNFYWDFGPATPAGPGKNVAIFSNLEKLELLLDGKQHSVLYPDRAHFPHLKYPPFFADLNIEGVSKPELRIDGYIGDRLTFSRSFSADSASDQLLLRADDPAILGDGSDATRVAFQIVDKFGAPRLFAGGLLRFLVEGAGVIVGDNPFNLADSGGAGAVWIKARPKSTGRIRIHAQHLQLGVKIVDIHAVASEP